MLKKWYFSVKGFRKFFSKLGDDDEEEDIQLAEKRPAGTSDSQYFMPIPDYHVISFPSSYCIEEKKNLDLSPENTFMKEATTINVQ